MAEWTKEELIQADVHVEKATMQDSHDELHAAYKAVATEHTCQRNRALAALEELVALVRGECPSLLNEDSGGDAKLSMEIDAAIAACKEGK